MSASPRILSVVVCLLLLGTWLNPAQAQQATSRNPEAVAAYEEGVRALEAENWDDALAAFNKALEIDPNTFPQAYVGRGDALRNLKDYSGAITAYTAARDRDQRLASAYHGRGICYREIGQYDLAINDFNNAMEFDRNDAQIAADLGEMLATRTSDATNAVRILSRAVELDPQNSDAWRNLGLGHAQLRQWDNAESDLAKSVEIDPENFENYATQASIYLFQDDDKKLPLAITALGHAIEHYKPEEPTDPKVYVQGYMLRSDALMRLANDSKRPLEERTENYEKVIADCEAILDEMPDTYPTSGQALFRKGVAERMQGQYGKAITSLTDAILLLPPGESGGYAAQAYLKRGMCWFNQDEFRLARGDLQQAASLDYTDPLPHLWMGFTYASEDNFRSAIDAFGEAIAKNPNASLPYINRGLAYVQLGEMQRAAENFAEAVRVEPGNADNHVKRGRVYLLMEDFKKAFNAFDLALQREEDNVQAVEGAAAALRGMGRSAAAETYENRAQQLKAQQS